MPNQPHPVLVARPLVNPVLTRTMGVIRRHGATLSPAARQFYEMLMERWSGRRERTGEGET